jgi:two-component system alkaline phosphatase synthesis response regulator PhoP
MKGVFKNVVILDENQEPESLFELTDAGSENRTQPAIVIDKAAYMVYMGDRRITFPKKEFELLLMLASNPRKVFKREDILAAIWGADFTTKDSRSLDVHIRMLRRKLADNFITTVRGVGYRLASP